MQESSKKTYWPHMILGFLILAIILGYWTIKVATSIPVQETNDYMMKYQESDININEILTKKMAFDKKIQCVVQYYPLNRYDLYKKLGFGEANCPNADKFFDNMVSFPFHHMMSDEDFEYMLKETKEVLSLIEN